MKRQHRETTTVMAAADFNPEKTAIICKHPDCDQIIAVRPGWGQPIMPHMDTRDVLFPRGKQPWTVDSDGRLVIRCKQCGTRNRLLDTTLLTKDRNRAERQSKTPERDS